MYDQIVEHSPGAASINEVIRLERARQRASIIGRRWTLSARMAQIADRDDRSVRRATIAGTRRQRAS